MTKLIYKRLQLISIPLLIKMVGDILISPFCKGGVRGILIITLLSYISCSSPDYKIYESQKILMGTLFKIKACAKNQITQKQFNETAEMAFAEVSRLESRMSSYNPESIISLVNKNAGIKPVKITDEILEVVGTALEISAQTGGVFDISFGPFGKLWNIKHRKAPPSKKEIEETKKLVNYKNIVLDEKNKTLFLTEKNMSIGLGGIAKGYAAQKASEILIKNGIKNFIVNAGGDLYFKGAKNKASWTSAIKDPDGKPANLLTFKVKTDMAVVTSGDYERFFIYKGKKYHHIINPNTGYPAEGIKSITVFAADPALADGYATAFFVLGYEKSLKITEKNTDIAFIMIDNKNCILKSPNVGRFVEFFKM